MNQNYSSSHAFTQAVLLRALFENYESIYVIDEETSAFQCYHESNSYSSLSLDSSGEDFFDSVMVELARTIYPADQEHVRRMLSRRAVLDGLSRDQTYGIVYRLMIDGRPVYHKFRATKDEINGRPSILVGIRNVDTAFRRDLKQIELISSLQKKEQNHMKAILASAVGYLEANLTQDRVIELSPYVFTPNPKEEPKQIPLDGLLSYTALQKRVEESLVVENREDYRRFSNRDFLIHCYQEGEKRASVSFAVQAPGLPVIHCKKVFYLYQDDVSGDILTFTVTYDLTQTQRHEKERKELENELQMSRIRNSTSQMQPHFLYNVLGSLQEVILENPAYASEILGDFTTHLRSCIRAMTSDALIPFVQELANTKAYLNIETMRFGSKLQVCYELAEDDFSIVPLSLQTLVENAIRHGIHHRGMAGGKVTIRTESVPDGILITVADTGVGFDVNDLLQGSSEKHKESTGLKNLIFRLEHIMQARVTIKSTIGAGTSASIMIPKGDNHERNNR